MRPAGSSARISPLLLPVPCHSIVLPFVQGTTPSPFSSKSFLLAYRLWFETFGGWVAVGLFLCGMLSGCEGRTARIVVDEMNDRTAAYGQEVGQSRAAGLLEEVFDRMFLEEARRGRIVVATPDGVVRRGHARATRLVVKHDAPKQCRVEETDVPLQWSEVGGKWQIDGAFVAKAKADCERGGAQDE